MLSSTFLQEGAFMSLTQLRQIGVPREFKADDIIFHQGEPGDDMHVLLSGRVAVYLNSFNGFPIQVAEMEPGNIFGEMSILEGLPRSATVIALEDSVTIAFKKDNFRQFIRKQPEMTYKLLKILSSRIRVLNDQLSQKKEGDLEDAGDHAEHAENRLGQGSPHQQTTDPETGAETAGSPGLYPPGHKTYSKNIAQDEKKFTFKKVIHCPVCEYQFDVKMQKLSRMELTSTENDFRQRFQGFEPIYYSIWMCPICSYANFYSSFEIISKKNIHNLKKTANKRKSMVNIHLMDPDDINYVFAQYYMADKCLNEIGADDLHKAKVWIRLKWLYHDLEDEEMYKFALSRVISHYFNSLYNARSRLNPEQEQQVSLLLGELYLENNQTEDAKKHFMAASRLSGGKDVLKKQARDRLWDIKDKDMRGESRRGESRQSDRASNDEKIFLKA